MCTAVLQQELSRSVAGSPDSSARLFVETAKSTAHESAGPASHGLSRDILGIFLGDVEIDESFFEAPDCFKEYMTKDANIAKYDVQTIWDW